VRVEQLLTLGAWLTDYNITFRTVSDPAWVEPGDDGRPISRCQVDDVGERARELRNDRITASGHNCLRAVGRPH
jgi:hypothetical protein